MNETLDNKIVNKLSAFITNLIGSGMALNAVMDLSFSIAEDMILENYDYSLGRSEIALHSSVLLKKAVEQGRSHWNCR